MSGYLLLLGLLSRGLHVIVVARVSVFKVNARRVSRQRGKLLGPEALLRLGGGPVKWCGCAHVSCSSGCWVKTSWKRCSPQHSSSGYLAGCLAREAMLPSARILHSVFCLEVHKGLPALAARGSGCTVRNATLPSPPPPSESIHPSAQTFHARRRSPRRCRAAGPTAALSSSTPPLRRCSSAAPTPGPSRAWARRRSRWQPTAATPACNPCSSQRRLRRVSWGPVCCCREGLWSCCSLRRCWGKRQGEGRRC